MQVVAPAAAHEPAAHVAHEVELVAPTRDEAVPAAHRVQFADPAADQRPAAHCTQVFASVAPTVADAKPAEHCVHTALEVPPAPKSEYEPAGHCVQEALPAVA